MTSPFFVQQSERLIEQVNQSFQTTLFLFKELYYYSTTGNEGMIVSPSLQINILILYK